MSNWADVEQEQKFIDRMRSLYLVVRLLNRRDDIPEFWRVLYVKNGRVYLQHSENKSAGVVTLQHEVDIHDVECVRYEIDGKETHIRLG